MRALGLAALASLTAAAATAQRPAGWDTFVRSFDAYAAGDSVVGASVLVVERGRVIARHDRGWADRERRQPADSNTIYHWGSITKTLTAVAVMQLRDRGRLSLEEPVTRYVPELRDVHNPWGSMDEVTIGMLLSHSAGFQGPTWPWTTGEPWEPFEPTRWEQLVAMLPYQRLWFAPGSRYGYSNPAFIYLARVIERITGDAWQSYVYKDLFGPLGLSRSYFGRTPHHLEADRSNNYAVVRDSMSAERVVANGREFDPGITIPNGGWNAPTDDIARWFAFLAGAAPADSALARRYEGVLARRSLREMWQARYLATDPVAGAAVAPDSVGLSVFVLWRHGVRFVGHTGSQAGFRAFAYLNPATRAIVIAAFNTRNDAREAESAAGFREIRDRALALIAR
ncbi:MAG TPA: serine hydrolase domain-containing protein [Gemmatimonadales bacterium]|nr:serine hydrolase domain-containing protein [Gemmatimonadales bacterium]